MARGKGKTGQKGRTVATGPRSVDGKKASSLNSTTHGCRSERHMVLPGESTDEFEAIRRKWQREYPLFHDLDEVDKGLIQRIAEREWHLRRCERMLDETQQRILQRTSDPFSWTEEEHRVFQLMSRYHSKAERSFRAAWQDIETLRRNRIAEIRSLEGAKRSVYQNFADGVTRKPDVAEMQRQEARHHGIVPDSASAKERDVRDADSRRQGPRPSLQPAIRDGSPGGLTV